MLGFSFEPARQVAEEHVLGYHEQIILRYIELVVSLRLSLPFEISGRHLLPFPNSALFVQVSVQRLPRWMTILSKTFGRFRCRCKLPMTTFSCVCVLISHIVPCPSSSVVGGTGPPTMITENLGLGGKRDQNISSYWLLEIQQKNSGNPGTPLRLELGLSIFCLLVI